LLFLEVNDTGIHLQFIIHKGVWEEESKGLLKNTELPKVTEVMDFIPLSWVFLEGVCREWSTVSTSFWYDPFQTFFFMLFLFLFFETM
jgi:hypothetical protein